MIEFAGEMRRKRSHTLDTFTKIDPYYTLHVYDQRGADDLFGIVCFLVLTVYCIQIDEYGN